MREFLSVRPVKRVNKVVLVLFSWDLSEMHQLIEESEHSFVPGDRGIGSLGMRDLVGYDEEWVVITCHTLEEVEVVQISGLLFVRKNILTRDPCFNFSVTGAQVRVGKSFRMLSGSLDTTIGKIEVATYHP